MEADRLPWSPGAAPFVRSYLGLGPISAEALDAAALERIARTPSETGAAESFGKGASANWWFGSSWTDTLELESLFSNKARPANGRPDQALLRFDIARDVAGEALLAIGANFDFSLWLNGNPAGDFAAPDAYIPDLIRIPVALRQGRNDILVRAQQPLASPRFALRALESGATPSGGLRAAASVDWTALPDLALRSVAVDTSSGARIRYEVRAPGGIIIYEAESSAGESVRFDTAFWSDGPYEVACFHRDGWGKQRADVLAWYKGDPVAAARRAIESARPSGFEPATLVQSMLRQLMQERLDRLAGASPVAAIEALHSSLFEWEERTQLGAASVVSAPMHRLAWIDPADGSPQFCRAYLPLDYDPDREWPIIIQLHGFNPANPPYTEWWSVDQRHNPLVDTHGAILLEPHGRGNAQYVGIGEADVMLALSEARKRFSVDERRIYLTGESMGGSGTWLIGARHTGTFAAIAPVFGGWDSRIVAPSGVGPAWKAKTADQAFHLESRSSFRHLESLINTPVYALHGDADLVVSPDLTRHAVRLLQRWGYPVRYREVPGGGHVDLGTRDEIFAWLLQRQLDEAPTKVRIRSADLSGATSHWLKIEGKKRSDQLITVEAEALSPGIFRLDTANATKVALSPPPSLLGDGTTIKVYWNGFEIETPSSPLPISLTRTETDSSAVFKKPGLDGPISDIIRSPFAVVIGTASEHPEMQRLLQDKGEAFSHMWEAWQGAAPRLFLDTEVTSEIEGRYSLLLLGGPSSNLVSRRFAGALPFTIDGQYVKIASQQFGAPEAVVEAIWPHPRNSDRYIVLVDAMTAEGFYFWNPLLWNVPFGYPSAEWDWRIIDGRLVELAHPLDAKQAWVASGIFDGAWRIDPNTTWYGNAELRSQSILRNAPPREGVSLSESQLEALCGVFEISPWVAAMVSRHGSALQISIASAPPEALIAESESRFAFATTAVPVLFELDPSGQCVALRIYNDGVPMRAIKR